MNLRQRLQMKLLQQQMSLLKPQRHKLKRVIQRRAYHQKVRENQKIPHNQKVLKLQTFKLQEQ